MADAAKVVKSTDIAADGKLIKGKVCFDAMKSFEHNLSTSSTPSDGENINLDPGYIYSHVRASF